MGSALTPKMNLEKMDNLPEDLISSLPEALISHILSFLSIKEAALTSVLSKKWRYLFAFVPNLEFLLPYPEEFRQERDENRKKFVDFVDKVLALQGNATVKKFSLMCIDDVDPVSVTRWILNVLKRGVLDLNLCIFPDLEYLLPLKALVSKTLVRLAITGSCNSMTIDVEDVFLPNLKILKLCEVVLGNGDNVFVKLIPGCHVLEELELIDVYSGISSLSVSSKTLKRLTLRFTKYKFYPDSVSLDTPNLIFLEYSDVVAKKYPNVNFGLLAEADIDLERIYYRNAHGGYEDPVGNTTSFLMGICNVKTLCLTASTLEFFAFRCESIPIFINLIHLTINALWETGLESLPAFLKNCPNLETLVFEGLCNMDTNQLGDDDWCISSSQVKVLIIRRFGVLCRYCGNLKGQVDQVKHLMETMPNLEQVILYFHSRCEEDWIYVSNEIQMHPKVFLKLQDPSAHFIKD